MVRVLFVTRELYPFTAGGIGRVVANMLHQKRDASVRFSVLYLGRGPDAAAFASVYPDVHYLSLTLDDYLTIDGEGRIFPALHSFNDSILHAESTLALQGIRRMIQQAGEFDYIEFVDWGASAFCATQEKLLGQDFLDTVLAVRLHTTDSILMDYEARPQDLHALCLHDLERKALADCDLVVAQLAPVATAFCEFYGFAREEWDARVVVHSPPVELDHVAHATSSVKPAVDTPIVFSSKLQDIKRPGDFVQAVAELMMTRPDYVGRAQFVAHAFDESFKNAIRDAVPDETRDRFVFLPALPGPVREQYIATSICVFPSPWESYCLAAYEASLSGALCVLNGANPAFGEDTPWSHGVNCMKFDGTTGGLVRVLERVLDQPAELVPVRVPQCDVPWNSTRRSARVIGETSCAMAAIVVTRDEPGLLVDTVERLLTSDAPLAELIIVDDGSVDVAARAALDRIESSLGDLVRVIRRAVPGGLARALNDGIARVQADAVIVARAGDYVSPSFLRKAAHAFGRRRDVGVVTGQFARGSIDASSGYADAMAAYAVAVIGECRASGLHDNRFGPDIYAVRTELARSRGWSEALPRLCHWAFLRDLCFSGVRFAVSSELETAPRPAPALLPLVNARLSLSHERELSMRHQTFEVGRVRIPLYAFGTVIDTGGFGRWLHVEGGHDEYFRRRTQELAESETVRVALALANRMQRHTPWLLALVRNAFNLLQRIRAR